MHITLLVPTPPSCLRPTLSIVAQLPCHLAVRITCVFFILTVTTSAGPVLVCTHPCMCAPAFFTFVYLTKVSVVSGYFTHLCVRFQGGFSYNPTHLQPNPQTNHTVMSSLSSPSTPQAIPEERGSAEVQTMRGGC